MRRLALVAFIVMTPALAAAQSAPAPIDYTKPFLFDGLSPTHRQTTPTSRSISIETIPLMHRSETIQLPPVLNRDDIPAPFRAPPASETVTVLPVEPAPEPRPGR